MLETIREYAGERLRADVGDFAHERHVSHYWRQAESFREAVLEHGAESAESLREEHYNLREALSYLRARSVERYCELCLVLHSYFLFFGHAVEGFELISDAVEETTDPDLRFQLLRSASALAFHTGEIDQAEQFLEKFEKEAARRADDVEMSYMLRLSGSIAATREQWERAEQLQTSALALAEQTGDLVAVAGAYGDLAWLSLELGDFERALERSAYALRAAEELDFKPWLAVVLVVRCIAQLELGYLHDALESARRACDLSASLQSVQSFAGASEVLAALAITRGSADERKVATAIELIGACRALRELHRCPPGPCERRVQERTLRAATAVLGDTGVEDALASGTRASFADAVRLTLVL